MGRVEDFEELRFGMFIHFGLFSEADRGEWVYYCYPEEREEYEGYFKKFNPTDLDWHAIVAMAKEAGMKYITLTTRHHEGFSLYDTKGLSTYDVMHTPYGKDIVREFVEECNAQGIVPMLYHTLHDWQLPLFKEDFDKYLEYLRESVKVLCTEYGKIGGFWFDGKWSNLSADWQEDELYGMIRKYQPEAILINNTGLEGRGVRGHEELDTLTFEQGSIEQSQLRDAGRHLAMEACETMNHYWGCAGEDLDYKSPRDLIEMLCACRKLNANYLLNIGPKANGEVPLISKGLLECLGKWTKYAGEMFYKGTVSEIKCVNEKDFALDYEGKTYLFVHDLPLLGVDGLVYAGKEIEGPEVLEHVKRKAVDIRWKDTGESLVFTQNGDQIICHTTGFPYGQDRIVRIAEISWEIA